VQACTPPQQRAIADVSRRFETALLEARADITYPYLRIAV
jgi:hypothetical protein